jgi:hypothetical protein
VRGGPRKEPPLIRGCGDELAALLELAQLLVEREDYEELRRRAARGDFPAKLALLDQLVRDGNIAELTRFATNSLAARGRLIRLLAARRCCGPRQPRRWWRRRGGKLALLVAEEARQRGRARASSSSW